MPGTNLFSTEETDGLGNKVALTDETGAILLAKGASVPADAAVGYAKGCLFIDTDGEAGAVLFVNEGTAAVADFNALGLGA